MVNIIIKKKSERNPHRESVDSKYHGTSKRDVEQCGRAAIRNGASIQQAEEVIREQTMFDNPKHCWENFAAGVEAVRDEAEKMALPHTVEETAVRITTTKTE